MAIDPEIINPNVLLAQVTTTLKLFETAVTPANQLAGQGVQIRENSKLCLLHGAENSVHDVTISPDKIMACVGNPQSAFYGDFVGGRRTEPEMPIGCNVNAWNDWYVGGLSPPQAPPPSMRAHPRERLKHILRRSLNVGCK